MLIKIDEQLENFSSIYGCYVNAGKVISEMKIPVLDMTEEETKMYSKLLKKAISGKPGENILELRPNDINGFRVLAEKKDYTNVFFGKIIGSLETDKNYCILFAQSSYDTEEETVPYFIAAICPIKPSKSELKYSSAKEFREASTGSVLASPMLGISYPSFIQDVDTGSIAYYFSKDKHEEVMSAIATVRESDSEIKARLYTAMTEAFGENAAAAAAGVSNKFAAERTVTTGDICEALEKFPAEKVSEFRSSFGEGTFKKEAVTDDKLNIEAFGVKASIDIEKYKTATIEDKEYILIPVEEVWKINSAEIK